jgi:hypothetical protein
MWPDLTQGHKAGRPRGRIGHGINPFDYLKDLFARLPAAKITEIAQFTPAAWGQARAKHDAVDQAA